MPKNTPINDNYRHELFCQQYVSGEYAGNGTRSYMAVYPDASEDSARAAASTLLANHSITDRITVLQEQQVARLQITGDRILQHLSGIAFNEDCQEKDQLKANELLMKHLAMLTERREVRHSGGLKMATEEMTYDEARELFQKNMKGAE